MPPQFKKRSWKVSSLFPSAPLPQALRLCSWARDVQDGQLRSIILWENIFPTQLRDKLRNSGNTEVLWAVEKQAFDKNFPFVHKTNYLNREDLAVGWKQQRNQSRLTFRKHLKEQLFPDEWVGSLSTGCSLEAFGFLFQRTVSSGPFLNPESKENSNKVTIKIILWPLQRLTGILSYWAESQEMHGNCTSPCY